MENADELGENVKFYIYVSRWWKTQILTVPTDSITFTALVFYQTGMSFHDTPSQMKFTVITYLRINWLSNDLSVSSRIVYCT